MMAVVETLDQRFTTDLEGAEVKGSTPEERIRSLYGILRKQYDTPAVFVRLQIVLNLQHDPDTSNEVNHEIAAEAARSEDTVRRLLHEAIGHNTSKAASEALFHALRGYAVEQATGAVPCRHGARGARPNRAPTCSCGDWPEPARSSATSRTLQQIRGSRPARRCRTPSAPARRPGCPRTAPRPPCGSSASW